MESMSQSPVRLLILEDDKQLSRSLLDHLCPKYTAITADDPETALTYLSNPPGYDVTLVDRTRKDGLECTLLERAQNRPIQTSFLVMSDREGLSDQMQTSAPESEDYIVAPFAMDELSARIETILCRKLAPGSYGSDVFAMEDLTINFATRSCFRNGERIPLSSREFQILQYFVEQRGTVVSRKALRQEVWAEDDAVYLQGVDRLVNGIQNKIEQTPKAPAFLRTIDGKGYAFRGADAL